MLTDASSLFHEPPDAERHVRVVWEDGGSNPASYPIWGDDLNLASFLVSSARFVTHLS